MTNLKTIPQKEAEKKISNFISRKKKQGVTELSAFDVVLNLRIPASQVEKVMNKFQKERNLREINE